MVCVNGAAAVAPDVCIAAAGIMSNQIEHIRGIKFMFQNNIFLFIMFAFIALTALYLSIKKPKDTGKEIEKNIEVEMELKGHYIK